MSKTRDEYLQNHWTRYPEMPARALRWGRVQQHYLGTHSIAEFDLVNLNSNEFVIKAKEVLIEGDFIALMPNNQVVLLAPNLTSREAKSASWPEHKIWQSFIAKIRQNLNEKSFVEVKTPTLVACPGTEPSLEVFETEFKLDSKTFKYYLPTSPELNLKKLLAEGAEKIYEIAPVFRNGEKTNRHEPEFLMLEWYRAFANLNRIKMDVMELVEILADHLKVEKPAGILTFTVPDLFKTYCQFDLKPNTTAEELKALAQKLNVDVSAASCIDDYFYLIFMEKIENKWPLDQLVFVEKYPPYQAALARVGQDGWAERFEFYWRGYEIGNAFHELNDPVVQRQRALEDLEKKKQMGKKDVSLDETFFQALQFGLPPSSGIAVGLERLYMALRQVSDISSINKIYRS